MPNPAIDRHEEKVHCRMLSDDIPVELCKSEQGSSSCHGCTSPTRRCTRCGKLNGIYDAALGRCHICVRLLGEAVGGRSSNFVGASDEAIGNVLTRVRAVALRKSVTSIDGEGLDEEVDKRKTVKSSRKNNSSSPSAAPNLNLATVKAARDPQKLFPLLMEHAVERDGIWTVSMPATILVRRIRLLPDEARMVLSSLMEGGYLRGEDPWREAVLLKTEGIEEIKAALEGPRGSGTTDIRLRRQTGRNVRRKKADTPEALLEPSVPDVPVAQPIKEVESKPVAPTPTVTSIAPPSPEVRDAKSPGTYQDVYASLIERGQEIGGEMVVRGSIPVLQIRWRIGVPDVMTILEKLLVDEHIAQRDGWRAIALLKDRIVDMTPLPTKESRQSPRSTPASHGHRRRPSAASPGPARPQPTAAPVQSAALSTDPLDAAIQAIEAQLHLLQEHREGVNQEMQALKASLTALQRAKARGAAISRELREALQKSVIANANLLATLQE